MIVILSYFHTKIGPLIFYSFPKSQLDEEISHRIYEVMDQPNREEFLTQTFENLKLLNYYFQIYSDWARGKKEMLLLSVLINQQISLEIEGTISNLCKKFSEKMQSKENIFTGFHIKDLINHDEVDQEEIKENESLIREWVQDLYWEIMDDTRKKSDEEKITLLLDDRYIFESLEAMSKELKTLDKEISLSDKKIKENPKIQTSISNLNKIIEDLYEGYIEKMTVHDIGIEFSGEEELDAEIKPSREDLIKVLEAEVAGEGLKEEEKKKL
ncbi:MAG: hypothetical protein ACFFEY_17985 [Candidatus Thorarchaeota archaeon]